VTTLATIAIRAAEKKLPFLVVGGHAVVAHGFPRSTFDIDLVVARDDQDRWKAVLQELGYVLLHQGPTFVQFKEPTGQVPPLYLMLVSRETLSRFLGEAVAAPDNECGAKIVSLRHLLALKCHAAKHGGQHRIVKDADDVIRLVEANRLKMSDPEIRELFLKHGTAEFYEKVRRATGQN